MSRESRGNNRVVGIPAMICILAIRLIRGDVDTAAARHSAVLPPLHIAVSMSSTLYIADD